MVVNDRLYGSESIPKTVNKKLQKLHRNLIFLKNGKPTFNSADNYMLLFFHIDITAFLTADL